ncbi:MAG: TonB-dependent receptor plug domain-containing protein [Deltaproteobacteria bacterium]|nr:TonB-dependent receptor plug domain-containing protein [Deltaproteobacteria bacterium]
MSFPSNPKLVLFVIGLSALGPDQGWAQSTEGEASPPDPSLADDAFSTLDLDRLIGLEVTIASVKATSLRESPGIVSLITREEILETGARDLIDVLRLVPGFFFGVDVQGVVGLGIRGNWAHEGKVLLMIDGQEINELGYQTLQFGHHFPVEAIERIEIIRGPGSAIYGGNAELGVIKVTTRSGAKIDGARGAVRYGAPSGFYGGSGDKKGFVDFTVEAGSELESGLTWSLSAMAGRSVRSDEDFVGTDGTTYDLGTNSELRPAMVNAGLGWNGLHLRLLYDGYGFDSRDNFDVPTNFVQPYRHQGWYGELGGDFEVLPGLHVLPKLSYRRQLNWWSLPGDDQVRQESIDSGAFAQRTFSRALANVTATWDLFDEANLLFGAEAFYDQGVANGEELDTRDLNWFTADDGSLTQDLSFFSAAGFAQFLWPNEIVNFTIGGRLEGHNVFGVRAAPRVALTKVFDNGLHAKLLASQAFRTPSFMNKSLEKAVDPNNRVKSERTTVLEAELGYQLDEGLQLTANTFYALVKDPIIYTFVADADAEAYLNRGQTATFGAELEARANQEWVDGMLSYSIYRSAGEIPEEYRVPDSKALLGAPQHKVTARLIFKLPYQLRVTPTLAWSFGRWAYTAASPMAPEQLAHEVLVGLAATASDVGVSGLDLALIAHDLLDQVEAFPQPYSGGHAPLSGSGRMMMLRLSYEYGR